MKFTKISHTREALTEKMQGIALGYLDYYLEENPYSERECHTIREDLGVMSVEDAVVEFLQAGRNGGIELHLFEEFFRNHTCEICESVVFNGMIIKKEQHNGSEYVLRLCADCVSSISFAQEEHANEK